MAIGLLKILAQSSKALKNPSLMKNMKHKIQNMDDETTVFLAVSGGIGAYIGFRTWVDHMVLKSIDAETAKKMDELINTKNNTETVKQTSLKIDG